MPQPYNYTITPPDPAASMMKAIAIGGGINQLKAAQSQALLSEQEALQAIELNKQLRGDLEKMGPNLTPTDIAQLMVRYPHMGTHFEKTYGILSEEQQKARIDQASGVYAALEAGENDVARSLLDEQAEAYRNSGMEQEAKTLSDLSKLIELSPDTARTSAGMFLASAMGNDKFTETFTGLRAGRRQDELQAANLTEAQAKAQKAAVEANYAESRIVSDLRKEGWEIDKLQNDIKVSKENQKIAAINAQIGREQNELKRQELQSKLTDMQMKREQVIRERAAEVNNANLQIDNMLNTADRILAIYKNDPSVLKRITGPIQSRLPTLSKDSVKAEELIGTLGSQAYINQIPLMKGFGNLSEKEGEELKRSMQSLSLRHGDTTLVENIQEIQRLMLKSRSYISENYGVPQTIPDTPDVETPPETLEQITDYYTSPERGY